MSSTTHTSPAPSIVANAPEGIVRIFVPTGLEMSKTDLRNIAAKRAGTINVGRVPAGKPCKLGGVTGHAFDFAPVARTTVAAKAAETAETFGDRDPAQVAALAALGLTPDQITAALSAAPAKAAPKAPAKAAPKADREVPAFLRKWENVTCRTCRDFGKVRGPGAGAKAGRAFRTQHGADSAPTAVPCPSHTAAAKGGKRK